VAGSDLPLVVYTAPPDSFDSRSLAPLRAIGLQSSSS
jgi:hypothetical protein